MIAVYLLGSAVALSILLGLGCCTRDALAVAAFWPLLSVYVAGRVMAKLFECM